MITLAALAVSCGHLMIIVVGVVAHPGEHAVVHARVQLVTLPDDGLQPLDLRVRDHADHGAVLLHAVELELDVLAVVLAPLLGVLGERLLLGLRPEGGSPGLHQLSGSPATSSHDARSEEKH